MSSSNLSSAFRRAKQAVRFDRVDEGRDHQAQEMSSDAMGALEADDEQEPTMAQTQIATTNETTSNEPKQETLSKNQKRKRDSCDLDKRSLQKKAPPRGIMSDLTLQNISDIASFLNLKEKALVRSLNKTWLKGSTLGTKVEVNPVTTGTNIDGTLKFVASSFPNLKDFGLVIDTTSLLYINGHSISDTQFSGGSLKRIFDQESICLDFVSIYFDNCDPEYTARILVDEDGLSTLHRQVSLRKLELLNPHLASIESLVGVLRPLVNLQYLRLSSLHFPESEHENDDIKYSLWRDRSNLMKAIGSLSNLRSLVMHRHCITDQDFRHLSSLRELRKLFIERRFGDRSLISLTDDSMAVIASSFPKLKSLSVCYNKAITIAGLRKVIHSCPLIRLEVLGSDLGEEHLESIVESKPSLRLILYGQGFTPPNNDLLKKATIASRGLCVFIGDRGTYKPEFDPTLLANHNATWKFIEEMSSMSSLISIESTI